MIRPVSMCGSVAGPVEKRSRAALHIPYTVPGNGDVPASVVRADTATAAPAAPNRRAISAPIPPARPGHDGHLAIQDAHAHHVLRSPILEVNSIII